MSLVPGEDKDGEAPPDQTGRTWFLRGCVGLAFALWSEALQQPLARMTGTDWNWGIIQTSQVYPLVVGRAPDWASGMVSLTFLAIIAAGVAVGTLAFDDPAARRLGGFLRPCVGLLCLLAGGTGWSYWYQSGKRQSDGSVYHLTPLAGMWLLWVAVALLAITACQGPPPLAEKDLHERPSVTAAPATVSGMPGPAPQPVAQSAPKRVSPGWLASSPIDLTGHTKTICAVAFSPDGRTLASSSRDKSIRLWDVESGCQSATLTEDNKYLGAVAFSPDGRTLASGSAKAARLWDLATGSITATLAHPGTVVSVAFSPDGRTLASCRVATKTVWLWDVATGREITTLPTPAWANAVAFSPDGRTLAAACSSTSRGWDGTIRLWDVTASHSFHDLSGTEAKPVRRVNSMAFSPDGRALAAGSPDGVVLWDVESGRQTATPASDAVTVVAFSPDGQTLATRAGRRLQLFNLASHQVRTLDVPAAWSDRDAMAFSPDGRSLAVPGRNMIRLWSDRS